MDAYSLDLRKKIVEAKERGMPTAEVANAKTFGVGVSSVKRYAAAAREGRPLDPKKPRPISTPSSKRSPSSRRCCGGLGRAPAKPCWKRWAGRSTR